MKILVLNGSPKRDRSDTMQECMIRADEKLYLEKRRKGTLR